MNWILIVMVAGNLHFTRIMDDETSCTKLGEIYASQDASYLCISSKTVFETLNKE